MTIHYRDARAIDGPALSAMARRSFTETFGNLYRQSDLAAFLDEAFGVNGLSSQNGLMGVNGLSGTNGLMTTDGGRQTVAFERVAVVEAEGPGVLVLLFGARDELLDRFDGDPSAPTGVRSAA